MKRNISIKSPKYDTLGIDTPKLIRATIWKQGLSWRNISLNMWMSSDEDEHATQGIVLIKNKRYRDFSRHLRMKMKDDWNIGAYERSVEMLKNYLQHNDAYHWSLNRIQLPYAQAQFTGRCAYTNTSCLFVEPAQELPWAYIRMNNQDYMLVFNGDVSNKQQAKGAIATAECILP